MKQFKNFLTLILLTVSLFCNILLGYYAYNASKATSSVTKITFDEHNIVIYCEKDHKDKAMKIDMQKRAFTIGETTLLSTADALFLETSDGKINLSDYGADAYVVNSEGRLLYSMSSPG